MHNQNHLLEALEIVLALELPEEAFTDAINDQFRLMAGIDPEDSWERNPDSFISLHH